jgi:glycosyltransferase involved in cell wall biosynthesis
MIRVLILCGSYPADLTSGAHLRFQNLCKQIAARNDAYLVCLEDIPEGVDPCAQIGVRHFTTLPAMPRTGKSPLRHFRLTNKQFLKRSLPKYLAESQDAIGRLAAQWKIDALVCLVPPAAEMLLPIAIPKLLDFCDSRTLTLRRILDNRNNKLTIAQRVSVNVSYFRERDRERALVRQFERTITISGADRDCLLEISGVSPGSVAIIPNGVSSAALDIAPVRGERKRSVVFWGNLDFPPNWTAVHYFNRHIFTPHLADEGVEWHIIGKGADASIQAIAKHPNVHLHGFVDDLYREIAAHGAMINPMVEGSGLKNKVLEAFACNLPVVSTTMGIEAVGARSGEHCLVADDPADFSAAVMRCLDDTSLATGMAAAARQFVEDHFEWSAIGGQLQQVIQGIVK